jgi:glyoxylase-like metal-dependent hydrolase (beta-lactamase superfamily II)
VFTGDALGIHLPDVRVLRPATPPPDIDVEAGIASIERIRSATRTLLLFSHFGPVTEVDELCGIAERRLRRWADVVHEAMAETDDLDRIAELLDRRTVDEFPPEALEQRDRYELLSDVRMNAMGLVRYWTKRQERERSLKGSAPTR